MTHEHPVPRMSVFIFQRAIILLTGRCSGQVYERRKIVMQKSDKELAVELAIAVIQTIPQMQSLQSGVKKPIDGSDVRVILTDCYDAVTSLNGM